MNASCSELRPGDHTGTSTTSTISTASATLAARRPQGRGHAILQRACGCGGQCTQCRAAAARSRAEGRVHDVLSSPGHRLDPSTERSMQGRFGRDFSQVRVHTDAQSAASAHAVGSLAYTVGSHIVFGAGHYNPATPAGSRLLAHELTHVVQQDAAGTIPAQLPIGDPGAPAETEAARVAADVTSGAPARPIRAGAAPTIARFSDTGHHVVEEAALGAAGFTSKQIEGVERGNVQRDYSQVGVLGNTALLCKPRSFGGYRPEEHFDNYMWDAVTRGWRTRGGSALGERGVDVGKTPISYIQSELSAVAGRGLADEAGLAHLGNAFHTVEDFFAHSNFVELMQGDTSRGAGLITGNPVGPSQSVSRILEGITPRGVQEYYRDKSETAIGSALPGTHTAMAHDDPTARNYTVARRLAALVIQDLGSEVLSVMNEPEPTRERAMRERVGAKVMRYLRPPDANDKWWERLISTDAGRIDRRLDEAARRTPITVNQCMLSPLKNIEASKDSPLALPFGVAIPTVIRSNQVWFQVGVGVTRPMPLVPSPGASGLLDRGGAPVGAVQITGTF